MQKDALKHEDNANQQESRSQDLLQVILGIFCFFMLCVSPWQIDLDVPYPFYKGPLLVPLIILSIGTLASLPACFRLIKPRKNSSWELDGKGFPKTPSILCLLGLLFVISIYYCGLEASTLVFLCIMLRVLNVTNVYILIGIPVFFSILFWFVFKFLLDLYFPTPEILYLLGIY